MKTPHQHSPRAEQAKYVRKHRKMVLKLNSVKMDDNDQIRRMARRRKDDNAVVKIAMSPTRRNKTGNMYLHGKTADLECGRELQFKFQQSSKFVGTTFPRRKYYSRSENIINVLGTPLQKRNQIHQLVEKNIPQSNGKVAHLCQDNIQPTHIHGFALSGEQLQLTRAEYGKRTKMKKTYMDALNSVGKPHAFQPPKQSIELLHNSLKHRDNMNANKALKNYKLNHLFVPTMHRVIKDGDKIQDSTEPFLEETNHIVTFSDEQPELIQNPIENYKKIPLNGKNCDELCTQSPGEIGFTELQNLVKGLNEELKENLEFGEQPNLKNELFVGSLPEPYKQSSDCNIASHYTRELKENPEQVDSINLIDKKCIKIGSGKFRYGIQKRRIRIVGSKILPVEEQKDEILNISAILKKTDATKLELLKNYSNFKEARGKIDNIKDLDIACLEKEDFKPILPSNFGNEIDANRLGSNPENVAESDKNKLILFGVNDYKDQSLLNSKIENANEIKTQNSSEETGRVTFLHTIGSFLNTQNELNDVLIKGNEECKGSNLVVKRENEEINKIATNESEFQDFNADNTADKRSTKTECNSANTEILQNKTRNVNSKESKQDNKNSEENKKEHDGNDNKFGHKLNNEEICEVKHETEELKTNNTHEMESMNGSKEHEKIVMKGRSNNKIINDELRKSKSAKNEHIIRERSSRKNKSVDEKCNSALKVKHMSIPPAMECINGSVAKKLTCIIDETQEKQNQLGNQKDAAKDIRRKNVNNETRDQTAPRRNKVIEPCKTELKIKDVSKDGHIKYERNSHCRRIERERTFVINKFQQKGKESVTQRPGAKEIRYINMDNKMMNQRKGKEIEKYKTELKTKNVSKDGPIKYEHKSNCRIERERTFVISKVEQKRKQSATERPGAKDIRCRNIDNKIMDQRKGKEIEKYKTELKIKGESKDDPIKRKHNENCCIANQRTFVINPAEQKSKEPGKPTIKGITSKNTNTVNTIGSRKNGKDRDSGLKKLETSVKKQSDTKKRTIIATEFIRNKTILKPFIKNIDKQSAKKTTKNMNETKELDVLSSIKKVYPNILKTVCPKNATDSQKISRDIGTRRSRDIGTCDICKKIRINNGARNSSPRVLRKNNVPISKRFVRNVEESKNTKNGGKNIANEKININQSIIPNETETSLKYSENDQCCDIINQNEISGNQPTEVTESEHIQNANEENTNNTDARMNIKTNQWILPNDTETCSKSSENDQCCHTINQNEISENQPSEVIESEHIQNANEENTNNTDARMNPNDTETCSKSSENDQRCHTINQNEISENQPSEVIESEHIQNANSRIKKITIHDDEFRQGEINRYSSRDVEIRLCLAPISANKKVCWWNEICKDEFRATFNCRCPQWLHCRSPGRYYNAYCSMMDSGYIWTQPVNNRTLLMKRKS